ncbi:hypothetical protein H5J25_00235 [Sphingomonas aliaeris]|uniref:HEPN/RES N-terminal domain-containing protein n=1 Tax=Sphingomonas aliaeris TaxID=2759526 RepID=A0A974NV03_9SPHN|nr:HEPN-associated N-terminal domain-containing protein [Sphingomonas aliaeris]QQV77317.1 hypothetical protein H5J25_00235 [Sphingomonas aliaeris]
MGIVKAWMMEMEERGYGESDDHVCASCVTDGFLAQWIGDHAGANACSFCAAVSDQPIAAPFEDFTAVVLGGLGFDWNEPTNEGIMYIAREGGGRRRCRPPPTCSMMPASPRMMTCSKRSLT